MVIGGGIESERENGLTDKWKKNTRNTRMVKASGIT